MYICNKTAFTDIVKSIFSCCSDNNILGRIYWLGASDLSDTEEMTWAVPILYGVPVSRSAYTNYKVGAPHGRTGTARMCLAMNGNQDQEGLWDDIDCSNIHFGICKRCY